MTCRKTLDRAPKRARLEVCDEIVKVACPSGRKPATRPPQQHAVPFFCCFVSRESVRGTPVPRQLTSLPGHASRSRGAVDELAQADARAGRAGQLTSVPRCCSLEAAGRVQKQARVCGIHQRGDRSKAFAEPGRLIIAAVRLFELCLCLPYTSVTRGIV